MGGTNAKSSIYWLNLSKFSLILALFFAIKLSANEIILANDEVFGKSLVAKISALGNETYQKTGIFVGIAAVNSLRTNSPLEFVRKFNLQPPFVVLILSKNEHVVDIIASSENLGFDKEQILSVMPGVGTIIPILTSIKRDSPVPYDAALFNGYADITEQIAAAKGVKLENAIGNTNKNTINLVRAIFYGGILLVLISFIYYKFKAKNAN